MKLETTNISNWLKSLSDSELVALQIHCEQGKLSYMSCSCLIGFRTANHVLGSAGDYCEGNHVQQARMMPYGNEAEEEFSRLGDSENGLNPHYDALRRERLMPLITAEQESRSRELVECLNE